MSHLFYLVGPPASGKRTVGIALSKLTGAALLDNHAWNDPIFRAFGADGLTPLPPAASALAAQMRLLTLQAVKQAPPQVSHILTNYLSDRESEVDAFNDVRAIAAARTATFIPVWLSCPLSELERRMPLPERQERLKLRDPNKLRALLHEKGNLPPPPYAMQIDTATLSPADAALLIAAHAGALFLADR